MNSDEVFLELYDGHYDRLFFHFRKKGIGMEEARDLTQETFSRVYKSLSTYRGDATGGYLNQIANNVWKNHLRHWGAESRSGEEVPIDNSVLNVPDDTDLTKEMLNHEAEALYHEALRELPPRTQRCFFLWFNGLKYREIAAVMEISLDTVKSLIYQGKNRLRDRLGSLDSSTGTKFSHPQRASAKKSTD